MDQNNSEYGHFLRSEQDCRAFPIVYFFLQKYFFLVYFLNAEKDVCGMFCKVGALENFIKFTGKVWKVQSLFLMEMWDLQSAMY